MTRRRRPPRIVSWESRLLGLVAAALVVFGVAAVYSASSIIAVRGGHSDSFFAVRQLLGGLIGLAVLIVTSRADYQLWRRFAWLGVGGATVLLVIPLLPIGSPVVPTINGVRRWVNFGLFTVQPSEVAKFALIAWAAMLAAKKGDKVRDFKWGLLPFLVVMIPMGLLIAAEPDLSTAALTLLLGSIVLFSSGARIGHFILLGILAVP
ncbi:MAG: FtsW/RodA/SpoVE family cell cycle protein, partial [Gemmatimonadales bacterium]